VPVLAYVRRWRLAAPATPWWSPSSTGSPGRCPTPATVEELTTRGVRLQLGGSVHDPTDPVGRLLFNVLAMVAEFESDLIKARTREGLAVASAAGKLRGRKPKLTPAREALLVDLHKTGQKSPSDLAELFGVGRSTVYRALERAADTSPAGNAGAAPAT